MRCPRCDREAKDGTVFCAGCGAPLSLKAEPSIPALDVTLELDRRAGDVPAPVPAAPAARPAAPAARPAPPAPPQGTQPRAQPVSPAQAGTAPRPAAPTRLAPVAAPPPRPAPANPVARAAAPTRIAPPVVPPPPPASELTPPAFFAPIALRQAPPPVPQRPAPAPADEEPSQWGLRPSQLPRERRPEVAPQPAPAPARPAPAPPAPSPARPSRAVPERRPPSEPTLDVVVGAVEVHLQRASDWRRVLSWIVDGLPFVALFALVLRLALERLPHSAPLDLQTALDLAGAEAAGITGPVFAGTVVMFAVYQALAHGLSGATLGKRLAGIRVVAPDGRRPGLGRATIRAILAAISLSLLGLGVLLALFTRSGRGLHDLLARTWVVRRLDRFP